MLKSARTAAAALLLGFGMGGGVHASQICDALGFELATLSDRSEPTEQARKFARAIVDQKRSLRQLVRTMRETGCSAGSIAVISGPDGECPNLEAKRERMERNLEILETKRVSLLSQQPSGLKRQRLVAALEANRCNAEPLLVSTPGEDGSDPLVRDGLDGFETIRVPSAEPDYDGSQFVDLGGADASGTLRTMCVRTCDGAYFPVSSHASTLSFRRDAQVCSMMCPGTETELYYHSIYQESADMRSTQTGRPYDEMRNAFRFRTEKPGSKAECGCNFALYYKEMMRRQAYVKDPESVGERQSSIVWLKPELRGGLQKPLADARTEKAPAERDYEPDRNVRVIGPQFLPDKRIDFTRPLPEAAEQ